MLKFWLNSPRMAAAGAGDGGGGGTPPPVDMAAFKTEIMTEINKAINGVGKAWKTQFDDLAKLIKTGDGSGGDGSGGGDDGKGGDGKGGDVNSNTQIALLTKQVKVLQEQSKEAERKEKEATQARHESERQSQIWNVINGLEMRDSEAGKLLFAAINGSISRDDDGNLIAQSASGPISHELHIKQYAESHPYLLKPIGSGGAGASGGSGGRSSGPHYDLDKMSVAEIAALKPEVKQDLWSHLKNQVAATRS